MGNSLLTAFIDHDGPLGLTKDFFFFALSVILLSMTIPLIAYFRDKRRWKVIRSHLGVLISYWHGALELKIDDIPDFAPGARAPDAQRVKVNPLNKEIEELQRDIGSFGFCMNADVANKVGAYLGQVNYLWYWVEYKYAGDLEYAQRIDVRRGNHDPFARTKGEIIAEINRTYAALMDALDTNWIYRWEWQPDGP
jgi:hypothetical protein